jgi:protein ImuB
LCEAPLIASWRIDPSLREAPLAVLEPGAGAARVVLASCENARQLGVTPGMTQRQARSIAPEVALRSLDQGALASTREALYDVLATLSPRVEPDGDRAWFDAGPAVLRARFGEGSAGEGALCAAFELRARRVGLTADVAVADDKHTARAAASRYVRGSLVSSGESAVFLSPLPLSVLPLSSALRSSLAAMGVRTVGAFAALPLDEAALRLGPEGARAHGWARGTDREPLFARPPATRFEERTDLDWEPRDLAAVAFVLKRLCDALVLRLLVRSLGAYAVDLVLGLEGGARDERVVPLPSPTRDATTMVHALRASIEARPPAGALRSVALCAHTEALRPVQLGLFDAPATAPDRIARTVARLSALVGEDRVGSPSVPSTHRPHAHALVPFVIERGRKEGVAERGSPERALRLHVHVVRPPRGAQVRLDEAGVPAWVRVEGAGSWAAIEGAVHACAGPFRVEGDWWTGEPFEHDEYDVELLDGRLLVLGYDRRAARWLLEGVYE